MIRSLLRHCLAKAGYTAIRGSNQPLEDMKRWLPPSAQPVIFDVGASIGMAAEEFLSAYPQAQLHCFEPMPHNLGVLSHRYGRHEQVTIVSQAIADKVGKDTFHINQSADTSSLLIVDPKANANWGENAFVPKEQCEVEVNTLDTYARDNGITQIDLLKMDIQGAEYKALQGASHLLNHQQIDAVYCEIIFLPTYEGQGSVADIFGIMERAGYHLFRLYHIWSADNGQMTQADALFVSPRVQERLSIHDQ